MATDLSWEGQKMIKRSAGFLLILVASVCGCTAVPAPKYYRVPLDISAVCDAPSQSHGESLRVARFHAVAPLRQDSLVTYHDGSNLVEFSPYACWESSPPDIVSRKLVEAFLASRLFGHVDSQPSNPPANYLIRGRILRFNQLKTDHGLYGEVGLGVEFVDQENREILWSAVIRDRQKAKGNDAEAGILAVGAALQLCIREVLQQVKQVTAYRESPG